MADTLLSTGDRLAAIAEAMQTGIPVPGLTVFPNEPIPSGSTPFVVLTASLTPIRVGLNGAWSLAELVLGAFSVHDSSAQAVALGDLVRTWVLTQLDTPGMLDVAPLDEWRPDDPGGVQQGREAWTLTLART